MPNRLECFSGFGIKCIYSNDAYLFQWLIFKPPQPPTPPNFRPISDPFWLIWFINQRALCNHAFFVVVGVIGIICAPHPPGTGLDIEISYLVYIFTIYPPYKHIRYLVILICSFQMAAILVFFFDLLPCPCRQS